MGDIDLTIISRVLFDVKKISEAPDRTVLEDRARTRDVPFEIVRKEEAKIKYKAIETLSGDIYLIQNPAAWRFDEVNGGTYYRPKPQFVMSYKDAKSRAQDKPADPNREWGV